MQRELWKVFLACAIGAGLGSLVALEVHQYLWWVGLIVGGATGYLSYEWRAVLRAIPQVYRAASGWRPPPNYWKMVGGFAALWLAVISWSVPLLILSKLNVLMYLGIVVGSLMMWTTMVALFLLPKEMCTTLASAPNAWKTLYYGALPVILFWHLPRGIIWLALRIPWLVLRIPGAIAVAAVGIALGFVGFVQFCRRFGWELFLRIHSEMRLLCGVDAMLGAAVGYFADSALIGAVVGGLFGVVNYAVVTERWLKRRGYLPIRS